MDRVWRAIKDGDERIREKEGSTTCLNLLTEQMVVIFTDFSLVEEDLAWREWLKGSILDILSIRRLLDM